MTNARLSLRWRWITVSLATVILVPLVFFLLTNLWVLAWGNARILGEEPEGRRDYAIVLGAGVRGEVLSGVLRGRMLKAIDLYNKNLVSKILVTGDGTDAYYNETNAMESFAIKHAVPPNRIRTDARGFSTYTSIVRAKKVFGIQSAYILSQHFHLSRAVWLANALGMDADGVPSGSASDEWYYGIREFPARTKDFLLFAIDYLPSQERTQSFP